MSRVYATLISANDLAAGLGNPGWILVDCRFALTDTEQGREAYRAAHIPGAVYAHLDEDLSGPIVAGVTGRHPLPTVDVFAATLSSWGMDHTAQLVAYDDSGGSIAARLWWLARWLGHDAVAVLDGGWPAWRRNDRPTRAGVEHRTPRPFEPRPRPELAVDARHVERVRLAQPARVYDTRSADRYRGENETIDPVAGHIPGAVSLPFADNLDAVGYFHPRDELRRRYTEALRGTPLDEAIMYCGSGVTAAHNLLAMAHAGLGDAKLYPGSWSEWITDPNRTVATGAQS